LLALGLLNEKEVESFPKRKAIYKYIGKPVDLMPDIYEIEGMKAGEYILLCTDGLSDVVAEDEILDMMSKKFISTEDKGRFLVEMAVERKINTGDNVTLIIIEG
jgi:protein phosphatase